MLTAVCETSFKTPFFTELRKTRLEKPLVGVVPKGLSSRLRYESEE